MTNRENRDSALETLKKYLDESADIRIGMIAIREVLESPRRLSAETKRGLWKHYENLVLKFESATSSARFWGSEVDKWEDAMMEELIEESKGKEIPF